MNEHQDKWLRQIALRPPSGIICEMADRIAVLEAEAMDMSNAYTALLDAVKKAATPDGCPMDEWADGWNACCRSILAALGGGDE